MENEQFFVNIQGAYTIRKGLLLSSKGFIGILKKHENFKKIREEKQALILKLDGFMKDIGKANDEFRAKLPDIKSLKLPVASSPEKREEPKQEPKKEDGNELDKLEHAISEIEKKLTSMKS